MVQNQTQTTYERYQNAGYAGMAATMTGWDADTYTLESATAGFGKAVSKGSAAKGCVLGGTDFIGITKADQTLTAAGHTVADTYYLGDNVAVHVLGDIYVLPGATVTAGQKVNYDTTTGVLSNTGGTQIDDAQWMTSGDTSTPAVVRLSKKTGHTTT